MKNQVNRQYVLDEVNSRLRKCDKRIVYVILFSAFLLILYCIYSMPSTTISTTSDEVLMELPLPIGKSEPASKLELYEFSGLESSDDTTWDFYSQLLDPSGKVKSTDNENSFNSVIYDDNLHSGSGGGFERSTRASQELQQALESLSETENTADVAWYDKEAIEPDYEDLETRLSRIELKSYESTENDFSARISQLEMTNSAILSALEELKSPLQASSSMPVSENTFQNAQISAVGFSAPIISGLGTAAFQSTTQAMKARTRFEQRITVGDQVELELSSDIQLSSGDILPKGTRLFASSSLQGSRLLLTVESISYNGSILDVSLNACSVRDGQIGVELNDALTDNVISRMASNLATSTSRVYTLANSTSSVIGSAVADAARSILQGGADYVSERAQRKRITIPSNLEIYLR